MEPIYKTDYGNQTNISKETIMGKTIIIRDRAFEIRNCEDQYQAMGIISAWMQPHQVRGAMQKVDSDRYHFPPIIGHIDTYDADRFEASDFRDPYEAIGFAIMKLKDNLKMVEFLIKQLDDVYIFAIGTKYRETLEKGIISDELKATFEKKGIEFYMPLKLSKPRDGEWEIIDGTTKYTIHDGEKELHVMQGFKLPCHIVIHNGGEYDVRCFVNTYQCLGFMEVNCGPGAASKMRFLISNIAAEKFSQDIKLSEEDIAEMFACFTEGAE